MIIPSDDSDAVSTNTLVQESQLEELPRFFKQLVYTSACFSVVPFALGLYNVSKSKLYSIPTIFGYVCTTPFHVVGFLLILQDNRQVDMRLPFQTTSLKTICHLSAETTIWLISTIACAVGATKFTSICEAGVPFGGGAFGGTHGSGFIFHCPTVSVGTPTNITLLLASILSGVETVILSTIAYLCFRHRKRKLAKAVSALPARQNTRQIYPKPISVA